VELLIIGRTLWRHRVLVAVGLALAVAVVLKMGSAPESSSASATTRVLADTAKSTLLYPAPLGAETTGWRARQAIELMLTEARTRRLAQLAGVPDDQLFVFDPLLQGPMAAASLPRRAAKSAAGATAGAPFQIALTYDLRMPMIGIEAAAPDRATAARLADAAATLLEQDSSSLENKDVQGLSFTRYSPIKTRVLHAGGGRVMAIAAAFMLFVLWCTGLAMLAIVHDRMRARPRRARKIAAVRDVDFV